MHWIAAKLGQLRHRWHQQGLPGVLALLWSRVFRHRRHVVLQIALEDPLRPTPWSPGEFVVELGAENIDTMLTPQLRAFLGGDGALEYIQGVQAGDRAFIAADETGWLAYGFVMFNSRHTRVIGERERVPLIGNFWTAPRARRRGLFKKVNNETYLYLRRAGYTRAVSEADPTNEGSVRGSLSAGMTIARRLEVWVILNHLVIQRDLDRCRWRVLLA